MMLHGRPPHSFDFHGLRFAVKCLVGVVIIFSTVRFGAALASERIISSGLQELAAVEIQLQEAKTARAPRSAGEIRMLEQLRAYEGTLATNEAGIAAIEALSRERLIAADLSEMKLYLFESGRALEVFDILSKGARGSRWEAPTGLYAVETKVQEHASSAGTVRIPFGMQFFGEAFIHGQPRYPDGAPVAEGFSGDSIRLATSDAEKTFVFAELGTPVFMWEGNPAAPVVTVRGTPPPRVSAQAFLVADVRSGAVFAEKNAEEALPMASISKFLTALVAHETIPSDRLLTVTADDRRQTQGTPGAIAANDTFTASDLLYPLLMESNNSVSYTLARYGGADNIFIEWMNDKARAIGMETAYVEEPSGLSPENKASARDILALTRYIYDNQSSILHMSRESQKTILAQNGRRYAVPNFNHFADNAEFVGGKTGYTPEARQTMTTIFDVSVGDTTAPIAIIVLGSSDRRSDVQALLAWFKNAAIANAPTE